MTVEEFIKGFQELRLKMPRISVSGYQNQNCPYGNAIYNSKNCYVCFDMDSDEGCLYCGMATRCKFCADCEDIWDSELCYESLEIHNSYSCDFSRFLRNCSDCVYSYDLLNCHNCFGCIGLRRKNYHIFNKPHSPEDYSARLKYLKTASKAEIEIQIEALRLQYPHVALRQYNTENCFGDNVQHSRNCFYCFATKNTYDGAYLYDIYTAYGDRNEDIYDCYFSVDLHNCYNCIQVGDGWTSNFCHYCEHLKDSEFCEGCFNSKNLFGCIYINHGEYRILNKQYTKEEYHKEVEQIRKGLKTAGKYGWKVFI
ncbi:hypothetical protein HZC21_04845 [Candidatus Peregrinibacteria bacterium]|nr:hypothetical protein [Candidatus Peregrinibacteria bacterium]